MPLSTLILASLLGAADPQPVVVTGHFWAAFISPMGEPFRPRASGDDMLAAWFYQADRNRDGALTVDEMQADADRFFATLDTDHDDHIRSEELVRYEWEIAPDVQVMAKTRPAPGDSRSRDESDRKSRFRTGNNYGFEGAGRYALLDIPEPVAAADTNFEGGISLEEFRQAAVRRFALLDADKQNKLVLAKLEAMIPSARAAGKSKRKPDDPDRRIANPLPPGN